MAAAAASEIKISVVDHGDDDEDRRYLKLIKRAQWLRAAILGANDGLLSTTSLMLGVGAAKEDQRLMIISGVAGAFAGACSMALGEFVSVSTQRDIEKATIDKCNTQQAVILDGDNIKTPGSMPIEVNNISYEKPNSYVEPSHQKLSPNSTIRSQNSPQIFSPSRSPFMRVVARDAIQANLVQDNGMEEALPNPYKAAGASGLAFLCGSLVPLVSAMAFRGYVVRVVGIVVVTSVALAVFGGAGARLGGSPIRASAMRVLLGGWISMALTFGLLKAFDTDKGGET